MNGDDDHDDDDDDDYDDDDDCYYVNLEPLARPPYTNPLHKPLTQTLLHKPWQKRAAQRLCSYLIASYLMLTITVIFWGKK